MQLLRVENLGAKVLTTAKFIAATLTHICIKIIKIHISVCSLNHSFKCISKVDDA